MFDPHPEPVELSGFALNGEGLEECNADHVAYEATCRQLADGWLSDERQVLPDDFENLPIRFLSVLVRSIDRSLLNGHDLVRLISAEDRLSSSFDAERHESVAELAHTPPSDSESPVEREPFVDEFVADEVAAALTLTRRASERLIEDALLLRDLGPVQRLFTDGRLDQRRAREFTRQIGHLPEQTVDKILEACIDEAPNMTTGQLRARIARLVMRFDPDGADAGMKEGLADRRIITYANPDHTATTAIQSVDPKKLAKANARINRIAHHLKSVPGETRSLDQLRADIATDLLTGRCNHRGHRNEDTTGGEVHLITDLATLAELSEEPGELAGYGPVLAEIARDAAIEQVDGQWTYTVTDNGRPIATGTLRRRPTAAQRRHLRGLYPTCVFPGCRMPATDCDIDHRKPFASGGTTCKHNLSPLCRHHHRSKHLAPWRLKRDTNDDHLWTSPRGHTYRTRRGPPD